jgi:hypothetical protein
MVRHRPVRVWFMPWKRRCRCGWAWFPCPDSTRVNGEPVGWNEKTAVFSTVQPSRRNERPLLTPGQEWRSRRLTR